MNAFLQTLRKEPLLADGAVGSYLFELTGRLSETNHVYEAFNLDHPEQVLQVHFAYLQAGASCLTTNTFGANPTQLTPLGQGGRTRELNQAGAELARRAIEEYYGRTGDRRESCFVLGSVGPTLEEDEPPEALEGIYGEQIEALVDGGVDAILFETFTSFPHLAGLVRLVREQAPDLPVVAQMALHQEPDRTWNQDPIRFVQELARLGAPVVGVNCCAPWEAVAFLDAVEQLPEVREGKILLSVMPNGGDFRRIGHRFLTGVNPEFMGRFARQAADRSVRLSGGCCEVHPPHIREMHNYLRSRRAGAGVQVVQPAGRLEPAGDEIKRRNGPFSKKLKEGSFVVSVEMLPARGTGGLKGRISFVEELAGSGLADALDITDGSRGIPLMPPGDFIGVIRERLDWRGKDRLELIPHFTARDLNLMGLQSRLIGYWARRIHNVLFVTGDPPKMSPSYPRSTAVFDLDSVALIRYTHAFLNAGVDFGGQPLGRQSDPRTRFTIGSGFEPEAVDVERELDKLRRKIDAGVDYLMTQPAFRFEPLSVLEPFRDRAGILVGVLILTSLAHAERMAQVPGVIVPDPILERMGRYEVPGDQARAGQEIAVEQIRWIRREGWAGLYLMSPSSHQPVIEALRGGLS